MKHQLRETVDSHLASEFFQVSTCPVPDVTVLRQNSPNYSVLERSFQKTELGQLDIGYAVVSFNVVDFTKIIICNLDQIIKLC